MEATLLLWVVGASLVAYVLTGGADFGAGVWDLLASGPRREAQRKGRGLARRQGLRRPSGFRRAGGEWAA